MLSGDKDKVPKPGSCNLKLDNASYLSSSRMGPSRPAVAGELLQSPPLTGDAVAKLKKYSLQRGLGLRLVVLSQGQVLSLRSAGNRVCIASNSRRRLLLKTSELSPKYCAALAFPCKSRLKKPSRCLPQ